LEPELEFAVTAFDVGNLDFFIADDDNNDGFGGFASSRGSKFFRVFPMVTQNVFAEFCFCGAGCTQDVFNHVYGRNATRLR
jgi:hypothetical protein